jgi:hypothetical protein
MDTHIPPPPRSGDEGEKKASGNPTAGRGASCTGASYYAATELPASTTPIPTPDKPTTTSNVGQQCVLGGVHTSESEEDMLIYGQPVHVHGSLAKHETSHAPVHHDAHGNINYAKAAKEEMHDLHEHPRGTGAAAVLMPGAKTGVEMWDKVSREAVLIYFY